MPDLRVLNVARFIIEFVIMFEQNENIVGFCFSSSSLMKRKRKKLPPPQKKKKNGDWWWAMKIG